MRRLLFDANLSPRTAEYIRAKFGFDVDHLARRGLAYLNDEQIVGLATAESRIVVTEDLDFGRLYYHFKRATIGIIVLRVRPQSADAANAALDRLFSDPTTIDRPLERAIVVIDNRRVRIVTEP